MRSVFAVISGFLLTLVLAADLSVHAEPNASDHQGQALRWKSKTIHIAISSSITNSNPNIKTGTDVWEVIRQSVASWQNAANVEFVESGSELQSVSQSGIAGDGVSLITIAQTPENLALFQNEFKEASARTRIFYNRKGNITEADIVLNPFEQFSADGTLGTFDLESTLTHEIGHLLGLTHSASLGSVMYANYGRNGMFGLQARSARTLSFEDASAIRGLYGADDNEDCCGSINGRLPSSLSRTSRSFQIWAEDIETGRVMDDTVAGKTGNFRLDGLLNGTYRIYAQDNGRRVQRLSALDLGEVNLEKNKNSSITASGRPEISESDVRFIGINGQLADAAIPLNAGRKYVVYLGGKNLDPNKVSIGSTSKFVRVVADSMVRVDFGADVSVVAVEVVIDPKTPLGDYSLYVASEGGARRFIVGGITVEAFADPWDISARFVE